MAVANPLSCARVPSVQRAHAFVLLCRYVFAKQIAKPIGKGLVSYSQQHPWMRHKVIEPVGEWVLAACVCVCVYVGAAHVELLATCDMQCTVPLASHRVRPP